MFYNINCKSRERLKKNKHNGYCCSGALRRYIGSNRNTARDVDAEQGFFS